MNQFAPPSERKSSRARILPNFGELEANVERLGQTYRFLIAGGIAILYLTVTVELARRKLIWTDEFFTLYLSRLAPGQLWSALLTGGDQHPPTFYLLHYLFLRSFGASEWVLRLPAILGFLLMMVCVYWFVARRTAMAYGLVAMLLPLISTVYQYAYEARGYSLLLGSVALAALFWQQVGDQKTSGATLGLAFSLTAGVLSHYYTILLLPAFAAAEVIRSLRRKTWNPLVWLALSLPFLPLAVFFPPIKASSGFAHTFWGKASPQEIQLYYETVLGSVLTCVLLGFAIATLYMTLCFPVRQATGSKSKTLAVEETVLGIALAAAPVIGYLFGWSITGVFVWRYAIGGVVGLSILFGFFCFRVFRGSAVAGWLMVTVIVVFFGISARMNMRILSAGRGNLRDTISWLAQTANDSEPIIIGDSQSFYALSYYSPASVKQRYVYLVDPKRSLKYLGHDTPDRSLWALSSWFGLNVQQYDAYVPLHPEMKVWIPPNPKWSWLLPALIDDGKKLIVAGRLGTSILFSASGPAQAPEAP